MEVKTDGKKAGSIPYQHGAGQTGNCTVSEDQRGKEHLKGIK